MFLEDINTFIQQGCIKMIKSDSKDVYDVTKDYISERELDLLPSMLIQTQEICIGEASSTQKKIKKQNKCNKNTF